MSVIITVGSGSTDWPHGIPKAATKRTLIARVTLPYYVWEIRPDEWAWAAAGNNGIESTEALASHKAKRWLIDGQ